MREWGASGAFSVRAVVLAGLVATGLAGAQARAADNLLTLGAGAFDPIDDEDTAGVGLIEFRPGWTLWILRPFAGLMATGDSALYGFVGLLADFELGPVVITPSLAAGGFSHGDGKDLGHGVEFRSQIEIAYRFQNKSRLGVAFNHFSNAGLGDDNPGAETISVNYSLPTTWLYPN